MDAFLSTYRKDYRWPVLQPLKADTPTKENKKLSGCCKEPLSPVFFKQETQALQVSAVPQSENSKLNQPDAFLHQLYDKNPYLYSVKSAPVSDDVKERILSQRFISTYQNDFGGAGINAGSGDNSVCCKNNEGEDVRFTSNQPIPIPSLRAHHLNRPVEKGSGKGKNKETTSTSKHQKFGVSEYVDSISKTGTIIMKRKLLSNPPRKYVFSNDLS